MSIKDLIEKHKKGVVSKGNVLQDKMDSFYKENKDREDKEAILDEFENEFKVDVYSFPQTCPEALIKTDYSIVVRAYSIQVICELMNHFQEVSQKILGTLPNLNDLEEIQE